MSEETLRDCSKTMLFNNSNYCPPLGQLILVQKRLILFSIHYFLLTFFLFSCMECYLKTITFIATSLMALRVTDHSNEHIRGRWSGIELPAAY